MQRAYRAGRPGESDQRAREAERGSRWRLLVAATQPHAEGLARPQRPAQVPRVARRGDALRHVQRARQIGPGRQRGHEQHERASGHHPRGSSRARAPRTHVCGEHGQQHRQRHQDPHAEAHAERRHASGRHEREGNRGARSGPKPALMQDDERSQGEDHRKRGDLLDRPDQLIAVYERGDTRRERPQRCPRGVQAQPPQEKPCRPHRGGEHERVERLVGPDQR